MSLTESFFAGSRSNLVTASVFFLLLVMSFSTTNSYNAYADVQCNSSVTDLQDSNYRGPVFLDSYWTDQSVSSTNTGNPIKKEVGPGDGPSTLAVVLVNRSPNDIINVQGVLNLPAGFVVAGTSGDPSTENILKSILRTGQTNPAVASYDATIPAGSTFTLYFNINVLAKAKIGLQPSQLFVSYYTAGNLQSCSSALLTVPFMLPGKVIVDAVSSTTSISPNKPNTLIISIENKGSADATGVVATILSLGNSNSQSSSSSGSSLVLQSATTQMVNLGPNMFNVGTIPAFGKTTITTTVYPGSSSSGMTQNVQIQLSYGNAYGYKLTSTLLTGVVVTPDTTTSALNISSNVNNTSSLLTAGKLEDLTFSVTNNGTDKLSNIVISLAPPSSSLSIVGDSKWTLQSLNPGSSQKLSTKVFASTGLIDTPASFSVNANYISNGVAKSDSLNLGTYVVGDIKVHLTDLSLSYLGNTPNIVGNLLNQGSTTGLFTSVQLLHPELLENNILNNETLVKASLNPVQGDTKSLQNNSSTLSSQYIGDLTPNSPTPFSIPLSGTINPGIYPVSFLITYADDLKISHELILDGNLNVQQSPQSTDLKQGNGFGLGMIILPIIVVVVVIVFYTVRKRQKSSTTLVLKNRKELDIESLLDDKLPDVK